MTSHERRLSIRKTPEHLAYLSLPSDNGGIVLDVSEGGLRFQTIAPVEADGPIHFRFAIDSATRIKAIGELAWKDETGKIGALRFIQLPDETREQIRIWVGQPKKSSHVAQVDIPVDISVAVPVSGAAVAAQPWARSKSDTVTIDESAHPVLYSLRPPIYSAPFNNLSMFPLALNSDAGASSVPLARPAPMQSGACENVLVPAGPESATEWESLASARNALPYNLEAPTQTAPSFENSMSPQELESKAIGTDVAVRQPIGLRHPFAAVVVTIALALVVSLGIFAYVSTSTVGKVLLNWGERLLGGPASQ